MALVTFDGPNKLIIVNNGVTSLDVKVDLYSDWKEWAETGDNSKYLQAMRSVGGDPITLTLSLGSTYFLMNGWRIRPYEGNHTLTVSGNLYTEEGDSPFINTVGAYNVRVQMATSNLVDLVNAGFGQSQVTQLDEIHKLHGLDPATPLVVTKDDRTAGTGIEQTIVTTGPVNDETVTVTRTP